MVCFDKINLYDIWYMLAKRNIASTNEKKTFIEVSVVVIALKNCHSKLYNSTKERRQQQIIMEWQKIALHWVLCVCAFVWVRVKLKTDLFWNFWCDIKLLSSQSKRAFMRINVQHHAQMWWRTRHQLKESVNHLNASWLVAAGFNWSLHRRRCQSNWTIPIITIIMISIRCKLK